jgi:hypothetical protein
MAVKIHLQANKGLNGIAIYARCAAQSVANGKSRRNSRSTYSNIPAANIVDFAAFCAANAADPSSVCNHCCDMALPVLNRQRAAKGLPPVKSLFD